MWKQINPYYITTGSWTVTKSIGALLRFGLWHGSNNHGYFATALEAKQAWETLTSPLNA